MLVVRSPVVHALWDVGALMRHCRGFVRQCWARWGASRLLASSLSGHWNESPLLLAMLSNFVLLEVTRFITSVSPSQPSTAVAVSSYGHVCGVVEVKRNGYVWNLVVDLPCRRQGVGSKLLSWCATRARSQGAKELWLYVGVDNADGLAFYDHLGFVVGSEESRGREGSSKVVRLSIGL